MFSSHFSYCHAKFACRAPCLILGRTAQQSLCHLALPMQKLRDLAFLSLTDGLYGSMYTQRMMQDDTQGCLQAVQREHRVSSSHSPLPLPFLYNPCTNSHQSLHGQWECSRLKKAAAQLRRAFGPRQETLLPSDAAYHLVSLSQCHSKTVTVLQNRNATNER